MLEPKTVKVMLLVALVLYIGTFFLGQSIYSDRGYQRLAPQLPELSGVREAGTVAIMAMMGGFRNIAANMLWLKSDEYWHAGGSGWWKMRPVLETITQLDPHFIDAWDTLGWHLAWNLQSSETIPERKPQWVQAGIDAYRRGISMNPEKYDLYASLAWLYHDKLHDYEKAIPVWQKVWSFKDAPVSQGHMLAHAYERLWRIDDAVRIWKECVQRKSDDMVARNAIKWWKAHKNDKAYLVAIWQRENVLRKQAGLPPMPRPDQLKAGEAPAS